MKRDRLRKIFVLMMTIVITTALLIGTSCSRDSSKKTEQEATTTKKEENQETIEVKEEDKVLTIDEAQSITIGDDYEKVIIQVGGVTIQDGSTDKIVIEESVGDGEVTLDNIDGKLLKVYGGGKNSIYLEGSTSFDEAEVKREDGDVRIVTRNNASIGILNVAEGSQNIIIEADVGEVNVLGDDVVVTVVNSKINNVSINSVNSSVIIEEGSEIVNGRILQDAMNSKIVVNGTAKELTAESSNSEIIINGEVDVLIVNELSNIVINSSVREIRFSAGAEGSTITVAEGGTVNIVRTVTPIETLGEGTIEQVVTSDNNNVTGEVSVTNTVVHEDPASWVGGGSEPVDVVEGPSTPSPSRPATRRPVVPTTSTRPSQPAETQAPTQPAETQPPTQPDETVKPTQPVETEKPEETEEPQETEKPEETEKPQEPTIYTVTFDSNGGSSIDGLIVDFGQVISKPADPIKANYEFAGWYSDENLEKEWDFDNTMPANDITLYGKWNEIKVSGISVTTAPKTVSYVEGDVLDLTGLVVTLTKTDATSEDVALEDFVEKGITTSPESGTILATTDTKVTINHIESSKSVVLTITVVESVASVEALIRTLPAVPTEDAPEVPDVVNKTRTAMEKDGTLENLDAIYSYLGYLENAVAVAEAKEAFGVLELSSQERVDADLVTKLNSAIAKIEELKGFVESNTTIGVGTYKEDYSNLAEQGAKGRIMVTPIWPFYPADGLNAAEGMTSLEMFLSNGEVEIVRNTANLDKLTFSKSGNWPTRTSGSFDLGIAKSSSSGSWTNELYSLIGDEVIQDDLPNKVVVEFAYKGVLFVIEKDVTLTPDMFIAEPTPQDITVASANDFGIQDSESYRGVSSVFTLGGIDLGNVGSVKVEVFDAEDNLLATNSLKSIKFPVGAGNLTSPIVAIEGTYAYGSWEKTEWTDGNPDPLTPPSYVIMTLTDDNGLTYSAEERNLHKQYSEGGDWASIFAVEEINGTYKIETANQLKWLAKVVNDGTNNFIGKTVKLMNDIDLAGIDWIPIGYDADSANKFMGTFDGNQKIIKNLMIDTTDSDEYRATGFFGALNGTAKNFTLDGVTITGISGGIQTTNGIAAVAGSIYPTGLIEGVTVKNANISGNRYVAGIAGYVYGSIKDCIVESVTLTATPNSIQEGKFDNGDKVGGIAGYFPKDSSNVISGNEVNNLTIKGYRDMAGIVGAADTDNAVISNHVYGVNVTVDQTTNTYGAKEANASAIVGRVLSGTVNSSNTHSRVNIFNIVDNAENLIKLQETLGKAGTGDQIVVFAKDATINMEGKTWTPINVNGYSGAGVVTIDGNGATITNLSAPLFAGGFAGTSGIVIKNLTIADSQIVSTNSLGTGAFIESVDSMPTITLENCVLANSTLTGSRTGGLIGWTAGYNVTSDGPVDMHVTIKNCRVTNNTITGTGTTGGIIGQAGANPATYHYIENCTVANNTIISSNNENKGVASIVGTVNVGEVTITNSQASENNVNWNTGEVSIPNDKAYGRLAFGNTGKLTIDGVEINE